MKVKLSLVLSALLMTGCLDVKDNDANKNVAEALNEQNRILTEQNQASVKLLGLVENTSTDGTIAGAKVELKVGAESFSSETINADGSFEISGLPVESDFTLHVSSADNSFLNSVVYGTTKSSSSNNASQNIGTVYVTKGIEKEISFVDSITQDSIEGLTFHTYAHTIIRGREGSVSNTLSHAYPSTYDADKKVYTLTLPTDLEASVRVSFDLDNDKESDYEPVSNIFREVSNPNGSTSYVANSINLIEANTMLLQKSTVTELTEVEIRLTFVDQNFEPLLNAPLSVTNGADQSFDTEYDVAANQYVANVSYAESITLRVPSFTQGTLNYKSAQASLSLSSDGRLRISTYTYNQRGSQDYTTYYRDASDTVLDIVLGTEEIEAESTVETVASSQVDEVSYEYNVFYSKPIQVTPNTASLFKKDTLVVTKGNVSGDDLVLPGTTSVSLVTKEIDHLATLSLSDTKLSLKPASALEQGYEYYYKVGALSEKGSDVLQDVSNDNSSEFKVSVTAPVVFDINSLVLDNDNYYTEGALITDKNTNNEASTQFQRSDTPQLILPLYFADMFENFTLNQVGYTRNGIPTVDSDNNVLVENGNLRISSQVYHLIQLASNESLNTDNINSGSILRGTSLINQRALVFQPSYISLSDNTVGNENSVTYNYSYETKAGVIGSGTVKLYVK